MKAFVKQKGAPEKAMLAGLLFSLAISGIFMGYKVHAARQRICVQNLESTPRGKTIQRTEFTGRKTKRTGTPTKNEQTLFSSKLRVMAIGSAYPIPYEAEVCPFSNVPQPKLNQLDWDADGITDDWELKFGLNKCDAADALTDLDEDGFSNLEEFLASTDPKDSAKHPPYVSKFRFVEKKKIPFPFVFQGIIKLSDGSTVFQLNHPADGKTHFVSLGDALEDVVIKQFIPKSEGGAARLFVMRGRSEVELIRGVISDDPKSEVELINILDRSSIVATMGALLYLGGDQYAVLGVHPDKIVVKDQKSGMVYEIVSLTAGKL